MWECDPPGALWTDGKPWTNEQIARAMSGDCQENLSLLKELEDMGVPGRNEVGALCNKRMLRDEIKRETWRKWQADHRTKSGTDTCGKKPDISAMSGDSQRYVRPLSTRSSSSVLTSTTTPPTPLTGGNGKVHTKLERLIPHEFKCPGGPVIVWAKPGARLVTQQQAEALVGSMAQEYLEFFRRRGFRAEIKT